MNGVAGHDADWRWLGLFQEGFGFTIAPAALALWTSVTDRVYSDGVSDMVWDILLVGGGHSHVAVLADWARRGNPAKRAALLTPQPFLRYSGMVPGWIAGEHTSEAGLVDLAGLAKAAGVDLILDRCVAMDPVSRHVLSLDNGLISFRIASIDVGGVGRAASVLGDDPRLRDVRPIGAFVDTLERDLPKAGHRIGPVRVGWMWMKMGSFALTAINARLPIRISLRLAIAPSASTPASTIPASTPFTLDPFWPPICAAR